MSVPEFGLVVPGCKSASCFAFESLGHFPVSLYKHDLPGWGNRFNHGYGWIQEGEGEADPRPQIGLSPLPRRSSCLPSGLADLSEIRRSPCQSCFLICLTTRPSRHAVWIFLKSATPAKRSRMRVRRANLFRRMSSSLSITRTDSKKASMNPLSFDMASSASL